MAAEENVKQGWKRKLEEAKKEKNEVLKCIAKRKLSKEINENVECSSVCHSCKRKIKSGCEFCFDDCQNLSNELCILKCHKKHFQKW